MTSLERAWERELFAHLGEIKAGPRPPEGEAGRLPAAGPRPIAADGIGAAVAVRPGRDDAVALKPGVDTPVVTRPVRPIPTVRPDLHVTDGDGLKDVKWVRPVRLDPKWQIKPLPTKPVRPVQTISPPLTVGEYQLWAMPDNLGVLGVRAGGIAFFALSRPRLEAFSVTLRVEQRAGTLVLTGGDASLALSAYGEDTLGDVEAHRTAWEAALVAAGHGNRAWIYQPLVLSGLRALVDLPEAYLAGPPVVSVAADMGDASIRLPLSAFGAQAFKTALQAKRGDTLPGVCTLSAHFLAQHGTSLTTRQQDLVGTLASLLAGAGPEHIRTVNPQVTIEANVIVRGHSLLDSAVVTWVPNEGHVPEALTFGPSGGEYKGVIASDDVGRVKIDWNAVVRFKPAGWPNVVAKGTQSVAVNDWNVNLNPESWIAGYSIVVLPLDARGSVIPPAVALAEGETLSCELRYAAPFLAGGRPLTTVFQTRNEAVQAAFPVPPGAAPGEVRLTVFAIRGGKDAMAVRVLKPDESLVVVRVFADARIDIKTNQDPVEESSVAARTFAALAGLTRAGEGPQ